GALLLDDGLLRDLLSRRLGDGPGRGLLRHRGGSGAGRLGGCLAAGIAVAGVVALALGGLAVALAHVCSWNRVLKVRIATRARPAILPCTAPLACPAHPLEESPLSQGAPRRGGVWKPKAGARNTRSGFWD